MNKYDAMTSASMYSENTLCEELSKTESAKMILEDMDMILAELRQELVRIDSAIYSPGVTSGENNNNTADECLLDTLNRQRELAKNLLNLAIHIREGLW